MSTAARSLLVIRLGCTGAKLTATILQEMKRTADATEWLRCASAAEWARREFLND